MFEKLKKFLEVDMRMSHIYQPVMIRALLERSGSADVTTIAGELLAYDTGQIEYYEQVTKRMVGKVLTDNRKITSKSGSTYFLNGFEQLDKIEALVLIDICNQRIEAYIKKRGEKIFKHRHLNNDPVPGQARYEVLKKAKGRCLLCGVSNKEKGLDVDHILPRSKGGSNDISNLQALCYTCNRQKGNRDDMSLMDIGALFKYRDNECIFCNPVNKKVEENELAFAIADNFPVTLNHHLVIPKRHTADYFTLEETEIMSINRMLFALKKQLESTDETITGFNVGVNSGLSAGQTVNHCHIHLIPRRDGDMDNPRGGVRGVIPDKQQY